MSYTRTLGRIRQHASRLYYARVSAPVAFWLAAGRPPQFRPHIPWWAPLLYLLTDR